MGGEFRTKGVNIALGPVISPLGRMAEGGRNWEGCCCTHKLIVRTLT